MKMSHNPINYPSSPSSSKDEKLSHHSFDNDISDDWMPFDCSPPWSDEKEDLKEDKDEDKEDDADDDADDDSNSPAPKRVKQA